MLGSKWEIITSKPIIKDQWISLRADTCRKPNGNIITPYYVLEYPDWVDIVALTPNNELILVKQYRHGLGIDTIGLPCGTVDPGETPLEAAKRELAEETGYQGEDYILTGKVSANPANHSNLNHCFLVKDIQLDPDVEKDPHEDLEVFFVPLDEVVDMIQQGIFIQSLHISALMFSFRHLGMI